MDNKKIIKKCRSERTQQEYADYLGISIRAVQNWETRGTSKTTLQLLFKIYTLQKEIDELEQKLESNQLTYTLK